MQTAGLCTAELWNLGVFLVWNPKAWTKNRFQISFFCVLQVTETKLGIRLSHSEKGSYILISRHGRQLRRQIIIWKLS